MGVPAGHALVTLSPTLSVKLLTQNAVIVVKFNFKLFVCVCTGAWIKSGWANVKREGNQLTLNYLAPQLGYWVAAMSPLHSGEKLNWQKLHVPHDTQHTSWHAIDVA